MVKKTSKRQNVKTPKETDGGDCRLSIVDCRMEGSDQAIDNRKSQIDNSQLAAIVRALESVTDPEIPVVNVVEMGMIAGVRMEADCVIIDISHEIESFNVRTAAFILQKSMLTFSVQSWRSICPG